ncbi:Tap42 protein [Saccharomycopsis crataegensis]|uniref:Tap42 protein n=1 Tax=Saccharomycopsis crataegensis TaxID=43959 RepID=A0AAV5QRN1_9ASCO|nr:Tap42 protein [Saccharomycopsis crataegensis]
MSSSEQPITINDQFKKTVRSIELLTLSGKRQDSKEYQHELVQLLNKLLKIKNQVYQLGIFSDNETVEDINTKDIKFLAVEYYLGELVSKKLDYVGDEESQNRRINYDFKIRNLKKSVQFLIDFLAHLQNYNILNEFQSKKLGHFQDHYQPKLSELRPNDPALRREEKIQNFKLEKLINEQLKTFEQRYPKFVNGEEEDENAIDEDTLRELYLNKLRLFSLKSFSHLEMLNMELEVLANRPPERIQEIPLPPPSSSAAAPNGSSADKKLLSQENDYGYTERVEFRKPSELISPEGKVLQPFTFVSSKDQIKKKVFGYGQVMPTMSVEEYIEEEIKRGGIKTETITGEQNSESEDSDEDDSDEKLYKAREWDEFKDAHHRGEGNMKNKG